MTYLRDAWYMAGWNRDFPAGEPKAATILGEPIVLFRSESGQVIALEDRCVHRLSPLSLGRCERDKLRCQYHGLLFAADGAVVEIPGQAMIAPTARVRSYPIMERHSAIWIWMGTPESADPALLPDFVGYEHPDWALVPGRLDYAAPAKLIHDNLLDLSHIAYVHANSFAGGNMAIGMSWVNADMRVNSLPRGVRVQRWMQDVPCGPAGPSGMAGVRQDVFTSYDFLVPGIFLQRTQRHPAGTCERLNGGEPDAAGSLFSTFTCQAVTPMTTDTACYFFAYGPWAADAERKQFFAELGLRAFNEDKTMIEAQYRVIRQTEKPRMMPMVMDKAVLTYEGVLKRLLRAQGGAEEPRAVMA